MSDTSGTPETNPTTEQESVADSATEAPAQDGSMSRGKLAAIGGGAAAIGLVLGLPIGWFAFDDGGSGGGRHEDRGRMSQQQGPGGGHQDGGGMRGGGKMPGGGQMMPGQGGGKMMPDNSIPIEPTTPTTQGSVTPQSLQQG